MASTRSSHRTRLATARQYQRPPGTDTRQTLCPGPEASEAADEAGPTALRDSQGDGGAGVRTDQAGPGFPAVPAAGPGKGEPGVVPDLHRAQPAEAVPVRVRVSRPGKTSILGPEPATPSNLAHVQAMETLTPEEDKTGKRQLVQAPSEPIRHSSDGLLA